MTPGGCPYSLIAIIDAMTNQKPTYKCVDAVAVKETTVLCLPFGDLLALCQEHPPANLRLAQITALHIKRVIVSALHNFAGLDRDLFSQVCNVVSVLSLRILRFAHANL